MKKTLFIVLLLPLLSFSLHKYYVSLTEIEFKKDSQSVEIFMDVFIDDLEKVLDKEYNIDSQINYEDEIKDIDDYFKKYLNQNLNISINNKPKKYTFIGKEYDGNNVHFYLEIENITSMNTIEVTNTMLLKYFYRQVNIIKIINNEKKESLFFNQKKNNALLNF